MKWSIKDELPIVLDSYFTIVYNQWLMSQTIIQGWRGWGDGDAQSHGVFKLYKLNTSRWPFWSLDIAKINQFNG